MLIREVEQRFITLFSNGKINGTVHTCVGQEFSAVMVAGQLDPSDFVFSNHRCHGHFISFTGATELLVAELLGKETGTCGGIGSSQHLCHRNFYSNGIQGGILPVAAGMALKLKVDAQKNIGVAFIGDGTLGEGIVYETLNLISLLSIPLLIVCEDNGYAQSTPRKNNLAGSITARVKSFGIKCFKGSTDEPSDLHNFAASAISHVRNNGLPAFLLIKTIRLNPHSKGDDTRSETTLRKLRKRDYLTRLAEKDPELVISLQNEVTDHVTSIVEDCEHSNTLALEDYYCPSKQPSEVSWFPAVFCEERLVKRLNQFFSEKMAEDRRVMMIGEDILSPYGGAFKVTNGLSTQFPDRVLSTPISEAGIVGLSNGLALAGMKPFVEIMFGDFVTLAIDQIVNHASKFHHMYNRQVACPVVIRTPMGGRRGYGPTHSQTLDKLLCGIDNVKVVALNPITDPWPILEALCAEEHPSILIENKADYGKYIQSPSVKGYHASTSDSSYPVIWIRPITSTPQVTVITYGGMTSEVCNSLAELFAESEILADVFVFSQISPFDPLPILASLARTKKLVIAEEGSCANGIGSEIVASTMEATDGPFESMRIGALPIPIPSQPSLESLVLPNSKTIVNRITKFYEGRYVRDQNP